jgi:polyisoprenoid-binding protein YceI
LSIKGFPQEVVLNVEFGGIAIDPWGNEKAGFLVTGTINKIAWGLGWNKPLTSGGFMLSEDVIISCEMELTNAGIKEVTKVAEPDFE